MQSIQCFTIPDAPECTVVLPQGLQLIGAREVDGDIVVYYMDPKDSDGTVTLTWYALALGMEVPDAFPGKYFARVDMGDNSERFLFFKQDAKKREPIVAQVPGAKPKDAE